MEQRSGEIDRRILQIANGRKDICVGIPSEVMCDQQFCYSRSRKTQAILYYDDDHLNKTGAREVMDSLLTQIEPCLPDKLRSVSH